MDTLYLVVPCYNEEEVLPETSRRLKEKLEGMVLEGLVDEKSRRSSPASTRRIPGSWG